MLKEKIEEFLLESGLTTYGFIPVREFSELKEFYEYRKQTNLENEFEEEEIIKRIRPMHYMEDGRTILSIAFPYYHEGEEDCGNGFSIYTKRGDYHRVVKGYLNKIAGYIESLGGKAETFVDSNTLPERYIAYLAGVGFIGRNNMIITKHYGSYVFLGEIITDLAIDCEDKRTYKEIREYKECGDCGLCYGECPTKSINSNRVNPNICLSYLTQKKEITDQEIDLLKGNVFGCDFCQRKCPYNETAKSNVLEEFKTLSFMNEEPEVYAGMDNKLFKEKISTTSCGWRGKNVIRRNAIISLHYNNKEIDMYKGDSPYINGYIDRLYNKKNKKGPKE